MDENFKYKHVTKLPWIYAACWTALFAGLVELKPITSFWDAFWRLFVFGTIWWFSFQTLDAWAAEYRRRILFKTTTSRNEYIAKKLSEWGADDWKRKSDE